MAAPPPWVILHRRVRLVPEGSEAEHPAAISVALSKPPGVTVLDLSPRVHPGGPSDNKLPYLVATCPSALLLGFSAAAEAPSSVPYGLVLARQFASPAGGGPSLQPTTGSAELVPRTGPAAPAAYNVWSVGITASKFGGYLIAELEVPKGSETAKLLRFVDTLFSGDADQWVETELPCPLPAAGGREWCPSGVVDHASKLWWFDLSWGLISCDPSATPLALRFHNLPPGRDAGKADPSLHATRFIGVSDSWLRYVDIARGKVVMWTWIPETGGGGDSSDGDHNTAIGWQQTYEMSFEEIWSDASYRDTHLLRMIPEILFLSPMNPDVVYFLLLGSLFVVDVPAHQVMEVIKDWPYRSRCVLPWDLSLSIAKEEASSAAACQQQRRWDALPDDVLEELLLRVPADDPVTLVRATAVYRGWCRIISTPHFHDRFVKHHRPPPLLGFLANVRRGRKFYSRFVPTMTNPSFPPPTEHRERRALDARNGRVLLCTTTLYETPKLEVWNPVTDELRELPRMPRDACLEDWFSWNAALLCSRHGHGDGHGECNADCQGGAFRVVLLDSELKHLRAHLYCSENDNWSDPEYGPPSPLLGMGKDPPALAATGLYFLIYGRGGLVRYDLNTRTVALVPIPEDYSASFGVLTTSNDGGLGLARIVGDEVMLWSYMETCDEWQRMPSLCLQEILPRGYFPISTWVGSAEGGIFFVGGLFERSVFTIYSPQDVRKSESGDGIVEGVVPYASFYMPAPASRLVS